MTDLWARVPLWLLADGGVRSLPAPARVALYDLAMNGGSACCGDDPSAALDGLCAGAGEHLGVMLRRRVVVVDHGRLMLGGPTGAAVHPVPEASAAAPSTAGSPKPDERAARGLRLRGGAEGGGGLRLRLRLAGAVAELGGEELAGHRAAEGCYLRRWVAARGEVAK